MLGRREKKNLNVHSLLCGNDALTVQWFYSSVAFITRRTLLCSEGFCVWMWRGLRRSLSVPLALSSSLSIALFLCLSIALSLSLASLSLYVSLSTLSVSLSATWDCRLYFHSGSSVPVKHKGLSPGPCFPCQRLLFSFEVLCSR